MKSKHYFQQFKEEIAEEHKKYKTHQESADISSDRCSHKGKVKMDGGVLRCSCGAAWPGPELDTLLDLFTKKV